MDKMAKGYEKFGTVTMSSPILIEAKAEPNGGGYFDFNLPAGPNKYYKDALAKVQGQSAIFDQFVQTSGFGLNVQADIPALMGYIASLHEYAQKLSEYQAQKMYLSQARELKAQEVLDRLPQDASNAERKEAMAKAAKIRAGDPNKPLSCPNFPPPSSCNQPPIVNGAPDANRVLGLLSDSNNFMKYLGLLEGGPAQSISNRSAITTAAGDTVTEGIFRLLGNPAKTIKFKDELIMFGVSMVTVSPGWLTNKNYTAELAVSCDYSYGPARRDLLIKFLENEESKTGRMKDEKLIELINYALYETPIDINRIDVDEKDKGEKTYKTKDNFVPQRFQKEFRESFTPVSAAVSPMTDVDALDLASSQRRQESEALRISTALSSVGLKGQAAYFREWAKQRKQDVHTRTAYAAVTAFSSGGFFGWRIKPRLQALENPASFDSKPENVLGQQAFPIVVIIGIDRDDLQLGFDVKRDPNDEPEKDANGMLRLVAYEPTISFRQTTNWLPNKSVCNLRERLSETERLRLAHSFIQASENLDSSKLNKGEEADKTVIDFINNRITLLSYHTLDSWNEQYIPIDLMVTNPNAKGIKTK